MSDEKAASPARGKLVVLTPGVTGGDGLSRLSREVVSALSATPASPLEVWSLMDQDAVGARTRPAGGSRLRFAWWGAREGLRPQNESTVVCLHAHLAPVGLPFVHRGGRLIHVLVGIEVWKPISRLQRAALDRASLLVAISEYSRAEFRRFNPSFSDRRVEVCHPGIAPLDVGAEPLPERPFALIVGRMSSAERYKGHDELLEVWGEVLRRNEGARLVVVGDGDDRLRLERKANQLGLGGPVEFLGRVSDSELDRLYRECAFFVMPSRQEGFGFVFLEAMRASRACIGAEGAASEIIVDGVTGFVVPAGKPRSLAEAVGKLWSDVDLCHEMGSRGLERFHARFTSEQFQRRLRSLVDST